MLALTKELHEYYLFSIEMETLLLLSVCQKQRGRDRSRDGRDGIRPGMAPLVQRLYSKRRFDPGIFVGRHVGLVQPDYWGERYDASWESETNLNFTFYCLVVKRKAVFGFDQRGDTRNLMIGYFSPLFSYTDTYYLAYAYCAYMVTKNQLLENKVQCGFNGRLDDYFFINCLTCFLK